MLDSMQENPRLSRAEVNDVEYAVFDGTDDTMLSGESEYGEYPVESVADMARIDEYTEAAMQELDAFALKEYSKQNITEAVGLSVAHTARNLGVKTIVAESESGDSARMITQYRL